MSANPIMEFFRLLPLSDFAREQVPVRCASLCTPQQDEVHQ